MTITQAIEYCCILNTISNTPIHIYHNGKSVAEFPKAPIDFVLVNIEALRSSLNGRTSVLITEENLIFGMVAMPEQSIEVILGPVSLVSKTHVFWLAVNLRYSLQNDQKPAADSYINTLPGYGLSSFLNLLSLLNAYFNKEQLEQYAILQLENSELRQKVNDIIAEEMAAQNAGQSYQAAYLYEQNLVSAIKSGDIETPRRYSGIIPGMHIGDFGDTDLRKAKNLFICMVATIKRAGIEAGMDLETAYMLSDYYIRCGEQMRTSSKLTELTKTLLIDYATHCKDAILAGGLPRDIFLARQFILKNLNRQISTAEVAAHVGLSVSQLTRKMKSSTGTTPGEYICRCKMEQAQKYLRETNRSVTAISETLCFSSPSYFSSVFKQVCGQTPQEYRHSSHVSQT